MRCFPSARHDRHDHARRAASRQEAPARPAPRVGEASRLKAPDRPTIEVTATPMPPRPALFSPPLTGHVIGFTLSLEGPGGRCCFSITATTQCLREGCTRSQNGWRHGRHARARLEEVRWPITGPVRCSMTAHHDAHRADRLGGSAAVRRCSDPLRGLSTLPGRAGRDRARVRPRARRGPARDQVGSDRRAGRARSAGLAADPDLLRLRPAVAGGVGGRHGQADGDRQDGAPEQRPLRLQSHGAVLRERFRCFSAAPGRRPSRRWPSSGRSGGSRRGARPRQPRSAWSRRGRSA